MKRRRVSKVKFHEPDQSATTTATDFSFSLTRVAVSQICLSVGYRSAGSSALDTLTLITTQFLQSLAGLAASFSNTANRTEANLFDIVNGLQDISLSTSDCFPGGSTLHDTDAHCLIKSAVIRNLSDFVTYASEIPFAKPLPRREIGGSSGGELTRMPGSPELMKSIPAWLPPFPDSSLYLEHCTKDRSDHLWENSDSVVGRETLLENSKSEKSRDRSGGRLTLNRAKVRFKVERNQSNGGGSCTSDTRFDRLDHNDGEFGRELMVKKKFRDEYIYGADIAAGEWPIFQ